LVPSVQEKLSSLNLRAQKGFGQHFLTDRGVLLSILDAAELGRGDRVVEVGPGLGILTRELASRAGNVLAVEIDRGLAANLRQELMSFPNVRVIEGDILKLPVRQILESWGEPESGYKVVANLPYYITTPVIHHFLGSPLKPKTMVVMVQREVAESMTAAPGDMSLLAVTVQYYASITRIRKVSPGVFYPPPKVSSMVLRLDLRERPAVDVNDAEKFFKLVRAGFSARRKQLRNSLAQGLKLAMADLTAALGKAGIDPRRRAETLAIDEWADLYRQLECYVEN
jgi:16S rRNA (adenine1518-N6/adenine1519-N6)-dimethyltransferase